MMPTPAEMTFSTFFIAVVPSPLLPMYLPPALFVAHSYTRIDPAQEIGRLRHSISLLEAYIFPHHRNNPALQRRPSEAPSHTTPKKEAVDPDVSDKTPQAHGFLGRQQGGLYAGPTSAATHLIMVIDVSLHVELVS